MIPVVLFRTPNSVFFLLCKARCSVPFALSSLPQRSVSEWFTRCISVCKDWRPLCRLCLMLRLGCCCCVITSLSWCCVSHKADLKVASNCFIALWIRLSYPAGPGFGSVLLMSGKASHVATANSLALLWTFAPRTSFAAMLVYRSRFSPKRTQRVRQQHGKLVFYLVLWAQSTMKDYVRAEHTLHSISKFFISQVIIPQVMFF